MSATHDFLAIKVGESRFDYGLRIGGLLAQQARAAGGRKTWVYFIQEDGDGPVKVGVAGNPGTRLRDLQVGNPTRLKLRSAYKGPSSLERIIHTAFAADRMVGEWFAPSEALLALADAYRRYTVVEVTYFFDELSWATGLCEMEGRAA